jgi:nuclear pore complex protein Nup98-Nup96
LQDGIPYAALSGPFKFSDFFGQKDPRDPAGLHEKLVWELAGVLFDPIEVPADLKDFPKALEFLRRDNLSAFWEKLVDQASSQGVAMSKSAEEKAIAALSGHRVPDACNHLLQGKDFHLATLVALLGSNDEMRKDIRAQLDDWQKARVLAEINQPIRAIYEILSGNVCVCDGAKAVSIEDRVDSFIISQRFGLDWRQAFGLRLWYAITSSDHLGKAVQKFAEDLQQDKETARPVAWYVEQNIKPLWDDQDLESRQDLLWGLLKLYANSKTDLESVIRPENSQLSPLNVRLSWQLSRALTSLEVISYGADAEDKADRLTLSFASQLTNEGNWLDAIFVLLHLCNAESRTKAIQDHLAHHAGSIGHSADSQTFATMLEYKIPEAWIWEAKALYMRSVQKDPRREVECLILAKSYDEAHLTFCKEVAPKAVIERDYTTLRKLLVGFEGREWSIRDWNLGGALYVDYLSLLDGEKSGKIDTSIVERLLGCLPAMLVDARHATFFETVAVQEISNVVAKIVTTRGNVSYTSSVLMKRANGTTTNQTQKTDLSRVLELPLTEDRFLKHTMDLSLGYYQMVFAGGR